MMEMKLLRILLWQYKYLLNVYIIFLQYELV